MRVHTHVHVLVAFPSVHFHDGLKGNTLMLAKR